MADRPIEQLTLREVFTSTERLVAELIEHVDKSFCFKSQALARLVADFDADAQDQADQKPISDVTVRTHAAAVLSCDEFSQPLFQRLEALLTAIDRGAQQSLKSRN